MLPACKWQRCPTQKDILDLPTSATHQKILIANRSEIAIRVLRAAAELDIRTVVIQGADDGFALHRVEAGMRGGTSDVHRCRSKR